jgi:aminotransferase
MDMLQKAVTPRTKAILLNYPSNPTGSTIDKKTLEEIASLAKKKNLIIITDEIYSAITYGHEHVSISSFPGMKERTILLNGFSKSHAMTGWRLGYICGPRYLIDVMIKIHQYTALCASSIAQYAAIEAIQNGEKDVRAMNREYQKRCNYITSRFNEIGLPCLKPEGAFYVFPRISGTGLSSNDFALRLIEEQKVAVVPGIAFGECGEGHIRCSYATSLENIREAMSRIENFVHNL